MSNHTLLRQPARCQGLATLPALLRTALLCCAALVFGACGKQESSPTPAAGPAAPAASTTPAAAAPAEKRLTIAVIPKGTIHEFWKTVEGGVMAAGKELDVEVIWKGPLKEDDRDAQIATVEDFISRGVDGIVLAPLDNTALRGPVSTAMRSKMPVVIFDSGLVGEPGKDFISFVATDNFRGGQIAGEAMARALPPGARVVLMRYNEGSDSTHQREEGFLEVVRKAGLQVVSDNQFAGVTAEKAQQAGENMIARLRQPDGNPGFDGLFCPNESTAFGLLRALQEAGLAGKIQFIGFDNSAKMVEALQAHQMLGYVVQNPRKMGYDAVATLVRHLRGEQVPLRIDTGAQLVTADNLQTTAIQTMLNPQAAQ